MSTAHDPKPPDPEVRYSDRYRRREHRKSTQTYLWGTWLTLLVAIGLANETLQGFRSGEWVDIGGESVLMVPWWIAAAVTAAVLAASLWCFSRYAALKDTAPTYQPGDGKGDDE